LALTGTDSAAAATASATGIVTATAATAKTAVQTAASETPAGAAKAAQTDTTAATGVTAAAVAATAPVTPKGSSKAPVTAQAGTAASGSPETDSGKTDPSATAAQQPAVTDKPGAANGAADAAKADASASSSSTIAATVPAHEHSTVTETGHTPTDPSGALATGTIQPQLPTTATAAPVGPSVTAATSAAVPLSGLALEIAVSAKNGKSSFEIRLDPAELGRIDVRIDVDRNGQMTSHLTVEKPETLSMLQQDAPQLQRALNDAGFKTGDGGLQFSLRDQSSSGQNSGNETGRNAQRLVISDEDTIPAVTAGRTYGRMLASSSGVDIRV
jgi:flagellar hook-length control protein FliK